MVVELEIALLEEGVGGGRGCQGTSLVEIKLTLLAPVLDPDPSLHAPITVERGLGVLERQHVERVNWMAINLLLNLHGLQSECLLSMVGRKIEDFID